MGIWDWLGPLAAGGKARGWDALPAAPAEVKTSPLPGMRASGPPTIRPLGAGFDMLVTRSWAPDSGGNSAVFACLQAIAAAIAEPEIVVYRPDAGGQRVAVAASPLGDLLARPNPVMSLDTLLQYVATCLHVDGNAYWRKLRAGDPETGNVVELWPISPQLVEPVTANGSEAFIDFYRYSPGAGRPEQIAPSNIVHFRYGLDDADHRVGIAPLKRLYREISSDEQATRYADRLLANLAINGLTLTFDKDAPAIDQPTADELKARITAAYGGDNVGGAAVLSPGATLTALGFSPEQMDLKTLHRVPEERISAVLGVPAIVAGLGSGLEHSTYSNVAQAREMFTETKLIPLWRLLASTLTIQLVPDFDSSGSVLVDFDTTEVRALAADENALAARLKILVEAGIISTDEARAEIGLEPRPPSETLPVSSSQPSEQRSRAYIISLPGRTAAKAAEDLPDRYAELQAEDLPAWETELAAFFAAQQRRVQRRLAAGADVASDLVTDGEAVVLRETLTPLQLRALGQVERLVEAELGIAFQIDDPQTRQFLVDAGAHIGGITETTRAAVAEQLIEGQQSGEGIPELARRLRDLPAFGSARARVVARTELAHATTSSSLASYRASGGVVVGVRVHDGDDDAACAAMNGRTFALDQAPPTLGHPNCTRALSPIVSADELTQSA